MGAILRSAARAGASPADAATNANAAVLAHSDVLIARLNARHPALAQRNRRERPRGPSTRWGAEQISEKVWRERHRCSLATIFQPVFQVLTGHCPLALIGLGERARVHVGDPILVRSRGVLGDDEPEQAERGLAGNIFALEQHAAEQPLRALLALAGRPP